MNVRHFAIMMDYRENSSGIGEILKQSYDVEIIKTKLNTGDYVIDGKIVIERKTSRDFVQSIIDGRVFRQAVRMRRRLCPSVLIIEGEGVRDTSINIHPLAIKGAIISLVLMWRIPVLFSKNTQDTAMLLWLIGQENIKSYRELSFRPGRRPKRFYKKQLYILQGLPGVGSTLAIRLLNYFGSVEKALSASNKDLISVAGVGEIKAEKIRNILTASIDNNSV